MVLVLDDDAGVTEYLGVILDDMEIKYQCVHTAIDALAVFASGKVNAAILDVFLPGQSMTGLDVAKIMLEARPGFPILFCTGLSDARNVAMLREYGDYLQKEFFFDTAKERIGQLIERIHIL